MRGIWLKFVVVYCFVYCVGIVVCLCLGIVNIVVGWEVWCWWCFVLLLLLFERVVFVGVEVVFGRK